ncbi:MAG: hypothetical protein WCX31_06355 [Salinivirgaceae bacterium]
MYSQETDDKAFRLTIDTLIVINKTVIDQQKVMMPREDISNTDTLKTNQKGIIVTEFSMNAITLGKEITLHSSSGAITEEMRIEILNGETKYKFIYLKDIILQSHDGRFMSPSTKSIKIIFSN